MAIRAIVLSRLVLALTLVMVCTGFSLAQDDSTYPIVLQKVTSTLVPSPLGSAGTMQGNQPENIQEHDWLKVEFQYTVNPPANQDYLDEATFKVYIEGRDYAERRDGEGKGTAVCFVGSVTYVNLYKGKTGYGVFYLAPSTVERYKGPHPDTTWFTNNFDVQITTVIAGQTSYVNEHDEPDPHKGDWPSGLKPIQNLVYTRSKTPFIMVDSDKYPAEKLHGAVEVSE